MADADPDSEDVRESLPSEAGSGQGGGGQGGGGQGSGGQGSGMRKLVIVLLLTAGVIVLNRFAVRTLGFDPSAMLALGFVILAGYTFGGLVERIGLPHITGYMIAGLALGPSTARLLPTDWQVRPFDTGLLNDGVMGQLSPLETLAVALIALTAGGELKLDSLKKGLRTILGMLGAQVLFIFAGCILFIYAISGAIPALALPGLEEVSGWSIVALGLVLGSISVATSPAATLAVINDAKAEGPFSGTILATVVLKDVVVVVLFAVVSTFAGQVLGQGGEDQALGLFLLQHIGGALLLGVLFGFGIDLYVRYVKAEILIFLTGTIFTASFLASELNVEPVVLFIAAGFTAANFSSAGDELLETVEKLSLPVYVVFFTLAGAGLHLDEVITAAPFALSLVAIRGVGIWLGVRAGARNGPAKSKLQRFGWTGFLSQAGVALSLASIVGERLGGPGRSLETVIIAGIAINELLGPIALKLGLGWAGEAGAAEGKAAVEEAPEIETATEEAPPPWPTPERGADAWGAPLETSSRALNERAKDLQWDLSALVRDVAEEPLDRFRMEALAYLRELRREFLRHHRRIRVQALDDTTELNAAEALRIEQSHLAEKWRAAVLTRSARVGKEQRWQAGPLLEAAEAIAAALPEEVSAPYEKSAFTPRQSDGPWRAAGRGWLRFRRSINRAFGDDMPPRKVQLRAVARYHLWGLLPERLESVAALHAQAEAHLAARTRGIFDGLVMTYDDLAQEIDEAEHERARALLAEADPQELPAQVLDVETLAKHLSQIRTSVDEELMLAVQEVDRIADDLLLRTSLALGSSLRGIKADLPLLHTPDLSMSERSASGLYTARQEAITTLERGAQATRETAAAVYQRLALEMELIGLEGKVKDILEDHASALGRDVRGRAYRQVKRVNQAILTAQGAVELALEPGAHEEKIGEALREATDPLVHVAAEAARISTKLKDQLSDERSVGQVLDALTRAAHGLTDQYRIPAGPLARSEHRLPPAVATVEIPFREWVLARIETALTPRLLASTGEVVAKIDPLSQSFSELERRVAFNVELAVSELSLVDEGGPGGTEHRDLAQEMVMGVLERHQTLFEAYLDSSFGWGDEVRSAVREAVLLSLAELRGSLVDGEVGRLRYQMARDVRGRRLMRALGHLRVSLSRSGRLLRRALLDAAGETHIDGLRSFWGLRVRQPKSSVDAHKFSAPAPSPNIPIVYRRLFSAQALEAGDILAGREQSISRAMGILENTPDGTLRAVAVVGPDGVGKSAFVRSLIRARRWPKVHELSLSAPATLAQVQELLVPNTEGHLYVITGLHWLSSREPGGFTPLRHLVEAVIADRGRNAFVVRADSLVWAQAEQAAPLRDAFPELVYLAPLSADALSAAVLSRHRASGYGLVFNRGETPQSRLEELTAAAVAPLSRPQEGFFRALHAASGGLLRDALRLWIASVEEVDEAGDFVHLGPVPSPQLYALRGLEESQLLTLYQVARQGWMNPRVLASLFRRDETTAEAMLMALAHEGILKRVGEVWRIAPHLRGATYRLLQERSYVA